MPTDPISRNIAAAALSRAMPQPAASAPPGVGDASVAGSESQYARADHTHVSSVFKAVKTTDANGNVTWTYPIGFFAAAPVLELTVENAGSQAMVANVTSNTAAGGSAKVIASQSLPQNLTSALLSTVFNVFAGAVPAGTRVHVFAGKATGT